MHFREHAGQRAVSAEREQCARRAEHVARDVPEHRDRAAGQDEQAARAAEHAARRFRERRVRKYRHLRSEQALIGVVFVFINGVAHFNQCASQLVLFLAAHFGARERHRHRRQDEENRERHDQLDQRKPALILPPQHKSLLHFDCELRRGGQDGLGLRIAQGKLRGRYDRLAAPDGLKYQRHDRA